MQKSEKILLIGANGSVGKFLVRQLAPKFETVALLRSEPKFDVSLYPNLKIIKGDATSQEDIDEATKGVSIIVSTYQNAKSGPNDALNYINRVISSMKKNHVSKLISVSGFGLVPVSQNGPRLKDTQKFPPQYKNYNDDMFNGSQAIHATQLDYTYIGCPLIKEQQVEGSYHVFQHLPQNVQWVVKAGHIASFIDGQIKQPKWSRKIIGIANINN